MPTTSKPDEPVLLSDGLVEGEPFVEGSAVKPSVRLLPLSALVDLNIQLDAQGMAEMPYDQSLPPGPVGRPAHIELLFDDAHPAPPKVATDLLAAGRRMPTP